MCRHVQARYQRCTRSTPAEARGFIAQSLRSELSGPALESAVDSAVLVVSELATNAIRAGCSGLTVDLDVHRGQLRVGVSDDAPGRPVQRTADASDVHGRGLAIVGTVARQWGVRERAAGKQVWATIDLPAGLTQSSPCHLGP